MGKECEMLCWRDVTQPVATQGLRQRWLFVLTSADECEMRVQSRVDGSSLVSRAVTLKWSLCSRSGVEMTRVLPTAPDSARYLPYPPPRPVP